MRLFLFLVWALASLGPLHGSLLAAPKYAPHPRLLFGQEDLAGLQAKATSVVGTQVIQRLELCMAREASGSLLAHQAAAWALRSVVNGDKTASQRSYETFEQAVNFLFSPIEVESSADLGPILSLSSGLEGLALAYDLCYNSWPANQRAEATRALASLASKLRSTLREGARAHPESCETITAWASIGVAMLAIHGDSGAPSEALLVAQNSRRQILGALHNLGQRGWPREGITELRLSLSHGLGAFIMAWRRNQGEDLLNPSPARWWSHLYATILIPPKTEQSPELPFFGLTLRSLEKAPKVRRWESSPRLSGDTAVLLAMADAGSRAALQWTFDHCFGLQGDASFDIYKGSDALFALIGSSTGEPPLNPSAFLSKTWIDQSAGLILARNRWQDSNDSLAAIFANSKTVMGLNTFADSGSFRLLALGGRWAVQRQRDKSDLNQASREKENVVLIPGTHGWMPGTLISAQVEEDGSCLASLNLDACYTVAPSTRQNPKLTPSSDIGIRAMRAISVDYSGACGTAVLLAVVDEIKGAPIRRWVMHTEERNARLLPDGFELTASNGSTLRAFVLSPARPRIHIEQGELTDTLAIDGEGDFFVIMSVQPAGKAQPTLKLKGKDRGLDSQVQIGSRVVYFDGKVIAIR